MHTFPIQHLIGESGHEAGACRLEIRVEELGVWMDAPLPFAIEGVVPMSNSAKEDQARDSFAMILEWNR